MLKAIGKRARHAATILEGNIGQRGIEERHKVLMHTFCGNEDKKTMDLVVHRAWLCGYVPLLLRAYRNHPVLGPLIAKAGELPW